MHPTTYSWVCVIQKKTFLNILNSYVKKIWVYAQLFPKDQKLFHVEGANRPGAE